MKHLKEILNLKKPKLINLLKNKQFSSVLTNISKITHKHMIKPTPYDRSKITPYNNDVTKEYKLTTYINASFVSNNYVAFQFPKQEFLPDFYEFIEKSNCKLIISLIDCKTEEYLHESSLIHRKEELLNNKPIFYDETYKFNNREIRRLRYLCWEDFLKPEKEEFLCFVKYFLDLKYEGKVFVHCLMGVGRTGTFIMYNVLREINEVECVTDEKVVDVLIGLRAQRSDLVYSASQLEFLYSLFIS